MAAPKKALLVLIAPILIGLLPGLVLERLGLGSIGGDAATAVMAGMLAAFYGGIRTGAVLACLVGVGSAIAIPASASPVMAALLMAAAGAAMGWAAVSGRNSGVVLGPIVVAFVLGEAPKGAAPVAVGVALAVSALYGAVLGHFMSKRAKPPALEPLVTERAAAYGAILALLLAIGGWLVVERGLGHTGAWMLMTILLVMQPYIQDSWVKTWQRAAGTVLGGLAAIGVGLVIHLPLILYLLAGLCFFLGLRARLLGKPYWRAVSGLTIGIVLLEGVGTSVTTTGVERLEATLAGTTAALLAMVVMDPFYRRTAAKAGLDHY